ncbi:FHA domain-containing protein [Nocardioides daeguensis]|uniref:FHA domain-containing protein n=1 Tax=Nocardioides daeguensis TaxID=908359 RepID=A0ABP6WFD8_9ACTN|nr:FHA domain-containing protein [Nocardioides daeguensis]MBV6728099.1 FHA domain-containing protein [Nocardioides daeguensis]MCR1774173.1 FHA domain-containing protein [Nocardioides daeguensis]
MTTLHVTSGGRTWSFEEPRTVSIGRDTSCDIVLTAPSASRQHAQLRSDGSGWVLVDTGSSGGTFLGGARVSEIRLTGPTSVRFGGVDGEEVVLTPAGAVRPAAPDPAQLPPPGLAQTMLPGTGPVGPGYVNGPGLLVRVGGSSTRFPPGVVVRIGRDPGNEVVVDDPSVSRLHGVVEGRPDGWWYVDRSSAGTFLEEDRVTQRRLEEPITLMLGHPTAGAEVEVVPIVAAGVAQKSIAKKKRKRTAALVGAVVAALVLAGGGVTAAVLLGGDDSPANDGPNEAAGLSTAELDRAKLASVLIIAVDDSGEPLYTGSGTIISEDGLILTNAHVGKPSAPGQQGGEEDPAGLLVALTSAADDKPAAPSYSAEAIVADGVLDLAVLKITADAEGKKIAEEDLDLPRPVELGDSDELRTGDELTALGFPAVAHVASDDGLDRALTVTRGVVSTFLKEAAVPGNRAWIDSDIRIGSGNSGGASINEDGELVGINSAVVTESTVGDSGEGGAFTGGSARIRPVNLTEDIIAIAEKGGDPEYVSPYLDDVPEPPADPMGQASAAPSGWTTDGNSDCSTTSTLDDPQVLGGVSLPATLYAHFAVTGLPDGTPFTIELYNPEGELLGSLDGSWDLGSDEVCASVSLDVPEGLAGAIAVLVIDETQIQNPVLFG